MRRGGNVIYYLALASAAMLLLMAATTSWSDGGAAAATAPGQTWGPGTRGKAATEGGGAAAPAGRPRVVPSSSGTPTPTPTRTAARPTPSPAAREAWVKAVYLRHTVSADAIAWDPDYDLHGKRGKDEDSQALCIDPPPFGDQCTMHAVDALASCFTQDAASPQGRCSALVCPDQSPYRPLAGRPDRGMHGPICQARTLDAPQAWLGIAPVHDAPSDGSGSGFHMETGHGMCAPGGCVAMFLSRLGRGDVTPAVRAQLDGIIRERLRAVADADPDPENAQEHLPSWLLLLPDDEEDGFYADLGLPTHRDPVDHASAVGKDVAAGPQLIAVLDAPQAVNINTDKAWLLAPGPAKHTFLTGHPPNFKPAGSGNGDGTGDMALAPEAWLYMPRRVRVYAMHSGRLH